MTVRVCGPDSFGGDVKLSASGPMCRKKKTLSTLNISLHKKLKIATDSYKPQKLPQYPKLLIILERAPQGRAVSIDRYINREWLFPRLHLCAMNIWLESWLQKILWNWLSSVCSIEIDNLCRLGSNPFLMTFSCFIGRIDQAIPVSLDFSSYFGLSVL